MIQAGKLRHRIEIQRPSDGRDSRGRRDRDWESIDFAWSEIKKLNGTEREVAQQQFAEASHQVRIRMPHSFQLTTKQRFVFRGRVFEIGDIGNTDEVDCEAVCLVKEVAL